MTTPTCPKCGATLPRPEAACPRCLLDLAVEKEAEADADVVPSTARRSPAPPPDPAELAALFPELELEALIGAGGMGAVYRARQKRLGRAVALKVLHAELASDPVFVERFLREAQALARLAHAGIVAVHDYGERGGRCFLVMEYVDGTNLRALLKQGLLAPRQALDIVRKLCDALQFAHDEGVVHRDIKPENVLIDQTGRVKIADFGLAKLVGVPQASLTDAGQVMGTPHYMAPEQLERPRDVDHRADLFSLGVVFYEMLTGELPLGRFAPPSQRVQVDVRLDEIVLKSLEHERERRYQQAAQVKTDVERFELRPAKEERHGFRLRSGVYLPRMRALLGGHAPTAWGWLAISACAWILAGASFDLGMGYLALLGLPILAWVCCALLMDRAGAEAAADEKLGRWVVRYRPSAYFLALLGLVFLVLGHLALWERHTSTYVSSDSRHLAGLEALRGSEDATLRGIGISLEDPAGPAPEDLRLQEARSFWMSNPYELYEVPPAVYGTLALLALVGAALAVTGSWRRPTQAWREMAPGLVLFLTPLAGWHALDWVVHGWNVELSGVRVVRECRGQAEPLKARVYGELIARGLQVHAEASADIVDRRSGTTLAEVRTLAAAPSSIRASWRVGWTGPERGYPHLLLTIAADPAGRVAILKADGGLIEPWRAVDYSVEIEQVFGVACASEAASVPSQLDR